MERDVYHDFVTDRELFEAGPGYAGDPNWAPRHLRNVRDSLLEMSGARNVISSVVTLEKLPDLWVNTMAVSFDSRAWTGLS